jgi:hypothetical protein
VRVRAYRSRGGEEMSLKVSIKKVNEIEDLTKVPTVGRCG